MSKRVPGSEAPEATHGFQFAMGINDEGKVCVDFMRPVRMVKMSPEQALNIAEGLVETAREAAAGIQIPTPTMLEKPPGMG